MTTSRLARGLFLAGVAFGAIALRPGAGQAQDTQPAAARDDSSAATGSGDIVVTARRVEERLQDVPLSVTAFGAEELDKRVINNFTDLGKVDPALYSPPSTPRTRFTPYIR